MQITVEKTSASLPDLFGTIATIAIQSFGGGSSTFFLMHQVCIQRGWLTEEEFVRAWALAQMAPGINLLKLATMLGYRLRGWPGVLAANAGMLLPSATITILMTAGFEVLRSQPGVQAIMKGIVPATIGLSLAMGVQMAQPIFKRARGEGRLSVGAHLGILAGAALLMAWTTISPVVIFVLSGVVAVLVFAICPAGDCRPQPEETVP